ncbi:MAG: hypothetical protein QF473_14665, partial [Planctomycetota bacterium]|nr:hypothetical protein [Planctomycetota bacterium]
IYGKELRIVHLTTSLSGPIHAGRYMPSWTRPRCLNRIPIAPGTSAKCLSSTVFVSASKMLELITIFILPLPLACGEIPKDEEYLAIAERIVTTVVGLQKNFASLKGMRVNQRDGDLPTLYFEHGVTWALDDASKPHSKLNARRPIYEEDGFYISLTFYRGRWQGAAKFLPHDFGDLKLWFRYGYRPRGDSSVIAEVTKIIKAEQQRFRKQFPGVQPVGHGHRN